MTHDDVLARDVVDGYVADTLSATDRAAFEEHLFECDACFAAVEATERLRQGIRTLAQRGEISEAAAVVSMPTAPSRMFAYAPWLTVAATVVLAAAAMLTQQRRYADLNAELDSVRQRQAALQQSLGQARAAADANRLAVSSAEANVPLAILQTVRSAEARATLTIPSTAARFVLWLESPSVTTEAALTLVDGKGQLVGTLTGLRVNEQGAIVAAFPAAAVESGSYVLRLSSGNRQIADYPVTFIKNR